MCGIIGVVSRPPTRPTPTEAAIVDGLDAALDTARSRRACAARCRRSTRSCAASRACSRWRRRSTPSRRSPPASINSTPLAADVEHRLDANDPTAGGLDPVELEAANAELIALKDALWAIRHDRLRTARLVADLAGRDAEPHTLGGYLPIQQALSAIDRLEVRGRDSAGLHVFVWGHDIDADGDGEAARRSRRRPAVPVERRDRQRRRRVVRLQGGRGDR